MFWWKIPHSDEKNGYFDEAHDSDEIPDENISLCWKYTNLVKIHACIWKFFNMLKILNFDENVFNLMKIS